eukprot:6300348-Lingulodinium_polyedra.AAC.1
MAVRRPTTAYRTESFQAGGSSVGTTTSGEAAAAGTAQTPSAAAGNEPDENWYTAPVGRGELHQAADEEVDGEELSHEEQEELERLEAWDASERRRLKEQRLRLRLLREAKAASEDGQSQRSVSTGQSGGPATPPPRPEARARAAGSAVPGTPTVGERAAALRLQLGAEEPVERSRSPAGSRASRLSRLEDRLKRLVEDGPTPGGGAVAGEAEEPAPLGPASQPNGEPWQNAMTAMAGAVTQLVTAMSEQREASVLKWERKRPAVRMEGAEAYMHEMVALENAFAELGAKTFRRRWAIFRPALEGRAKETVE